MNNSPSKEQLVKTSRRVFLKQSSIAALGLSLSSNAMFGFSSSTKKLRIGIVGGRFGTQFQFHEHPGSHALTRALEDAETLQGPRARHNASQAGP